MQPQQPPRKLHLEVPANLTGTYANAVVIAQTFSEIIMDFIQVAPNDPRARVQCRVIMTPANAKMFLRALSSNLERFEEVHGEIKLPPGPVSLADQLFGSLKPDEKNGENDDEQPE
jgi:hypothetical protein